MSGFTVEVSNNQHKNTVMVGVRVMLGSRSLDRAPSYIECFGRTIQVSVVFICVYILHEHVHTHTHTHTRMHTHTHTHT